jgi:hypothetical protein
LPPVLEKFGGKDKFYREDKFFFSSCELASLLLIYNVFVCRNVSGRVAHVKNGEPSPAAA